MPSVSEFVQNEAETVIKVGKRQTEIKVRYKPSEITTARIEQMSTREREGDTTAFVQMLEEVLLEWDVEGPLYGDVPVKDDNGEEVFSDSGNPLFERKEIVKSGQVIPLEAEILKYMSSPTLGGIWRELVSEQSAPDPQKSRGSRRR